MHKTKILGIRVTPEFYRRLEIEAKKEGDTLTDYCRGLLKQLKVKKNDLKEYLKQLRKIGVNLNQITTRINKYQEIDAEKLNKLIDTIDNQIKEIKDLLK